MNFLLENPPENDIIFPKKSIWRISDHLTMLNSYGCAIIVLYGISIAITASYKHLSKKCLNLIKTLATSASRAFYSFHLIEVLAHLYNSLVVPFIYSNIMRQLEEIR